MYGLKVRKWHKPFGKREYLCKNGGLLYSKDNMAIMTSEQLFRKQDVFLFSLYRTKETEVYQLYL